MGIILAGTVRAYLEHVDGNKVIISNLPPISAFREILVYTRTHKSPVTVYAMSDMAVAYIGDKYFRLFDRINILRVREKTFRAKILAYLHTQRDGENTNTVTIPFTKTVLADYQMANRSAMSMELRKMEDEGLITKGFNTLVKTRRHNTIQQRFQKKRCIHVSIRKKEPNPSNPRS